MIKKKNTWKPSGSSMKISAGVFLTPIKSQVRIQDTYIKIYILRIYRYILALRPGVARGTIFDLLGIRMISSYLQNYPYPTGSSRKSFQSIWRKYRLRYETEYIPSNLETFQNKYIRFICVHYKANGYMHIERKRQRRTLCFAYLCVVCACVFKDRMKILYCFSVGLLLESIMMIAPNLLCCRQVSPPSFPWIHGESLVTFRTQHVHNRSTFGFDYYNPPLSALAQ